MTDPARAVVEQATQNQPKQDADRDQRREAKAGRAEHHGRAVDGVASDKADRGGSAEVDW